MTDLAGIKFPSDALVSEWHVGLDCSILACPVAHPSGCLFGFTRSQLGHLRSEVALAVHKLPFTSVACWVESKAKNAVTFCVFGSWWELCEEEGSAVTKDRHHSS